MTPEERALLESLRPGDDVTIRDVKGAVLSGSVVAPRPVPGVDEPELSIRRAGGTVSHVPHDRIREVRRGR